MIWFNHLWYLWGFYWEPGTGTGVSFNQAIDVSGDMSEASRDSPLFRWPQGPAEECQFSLAEIPATQLEIQLPSGKLT